MLFTILENTKKIMCILSLKFYSGGIVLSQTASHKARAYANIRYKT